MHVYPPRDHVQICRCMQPDELRLQTLKAPAADDVVQPAPDDAANVDANDGLPTLLEGLPMRIESLSFLMFN